MGILKQTYIAILVIAISAYCVQTAYGRSVEVAEEIGAPAAGPTSVKSEDKTDAGDVKVIIPGRVQCEYEEATEDEVCQEHCLPKGYSYGICVSHTCSCI